MDDKSLPIISPFIHGNDLPTIFHPLPCTLHLVSSGTDQRLQRGFSNPGKGSPLSQRIWQGFTIQAGKGRSLVLNVSLPLHIVHITSVSPNPNSSFVPQGFTWFSFYTSCRTPTGYRSYLGFFVGPTGPVAQGAGLAKAFFLHITPAICSFPHITPAILLLPPFLHFSAIFFSPPKATQPLQLMGTVDNVRWTWSQETGPLRWSIIWSDMPSALGLVLNNFT